MTYNWRFASPEDYVPVCDLFRETELRAGYAVNFSNIIRRITLPMLIKHLITFHDAMGKLCGFVTFASLGEENERHMHDRGVQPMDWRSGKNLWIVDFNVCPECNGFKMLRIITRALGVKRAKYCRRKHKQIREVRVAT